MKQLVPHAVEDTSMSRIHDIAFTSTVFKYNDFENSLVLHRIPHPRLDQLCWHKTIVMQKIGRLQDGMAFFQWLFCCRGF